ARVNPSVPHWGGPVGLSPGTSVGQAVHGYGSSDLRLGEGVLSPMKGISLGDVAGGWSHEVLTVLPGVPGDSGSAFLDSRGRALGQLSTLALLPLPGANGVADLRRALSYMRAHTDVDATLAVGTQPFNGNRIL
ncbi:MAG TPA: hypothetical protein VG455_15115, partial [Acidimicrobiales bacterium]|nr:hypothetical protein [Acidimicrobiales bacterium]